MCRVRGARQLAAGVGVLLVLHHLRHPLVELLEVLYSSSSTTIVRTTYSLLATSTITMVCIIICSSDVTNVSIMITTIVELLEVLLRLLDIRRHRLGRYDVKNTSPETNTCDRQMSSLRHIGCHTDNNTYYTRSWPKGREGMLITSRAWQPDYSNRESTGHRWKVVCNPT